MVGAGGLQRWDILDNLTALVGKSMVIEEEGPDQTSRYRLLETMRAYARQQLAATGEPDRLKRWHAEHYAAFAGRAGPELLGPLQLAWQNRIRTEVDNLQAAVTWALTENGQTRQLAFRIVAALASSALSGRGAVGVWAEACIPQISSCPAETRAAVIAAAAWSAFFAGDLPLAQRRAEDALREPASSDWSSLGMPRGLLSRIYALTGQPERGARIAREGRQEAATRGIEVPAGYFHAMETLAWTVAGDHATARRPAMEAVQTASKVRNPALSAMACFVAAAALWLDKPRTALALIEDSLAPCQVGAMDSVLGFALSLAVAIRTRNGDLPGALALLPEATMQQHNDGNRLGLGGTLGRGAAVLAKVGEAEPAAVLAGAVAAHFPLSLANACREELLEIDEAQSLARGTLGEPAYSAAVRRGAAMDDARVTDYALGEFRRLAALHAKPKAQGPGIGITARYENRLP